MFTVHHYQAVSIKFASFSLQLLVIYIIIIPGVSFTYISLLNLMGILERAILRSFFATLISNIASKSGSSKHGKTRRALPEDSLVAANHLPSNKKLNVYCSRLQLFTAMLWRIQAF
jgi:ABC-type glucose/galactose transport system permease subunit